MHTQGSILLKINNFYCFFRIFLSKTDFSFVYLFWYRLDCSGFPPGKIPVGGGKPGKASKKKVHIEIGKEFHSDWQRRKGGKGKQAKQRGWTEMSVLCSHMKRGKAVWNKVCGLDMASVKAASDILTK